MTSDIFDTEIAVSAGRVFEGEISFNVTFSVSVSVSTSLMVTVNATVVKATRIQWLRHWFSQLPRNWIAIPSG